MKPTLVPHDDHLGCHFVETHLGTLILICRKHPFELERLLLPGSADPKEIRQLTGPVPTSQALEKLVRALTDYSQGFSLAAPWPILNLEGFTPLQQRVLQAVAAIPYGQVATYKQIAEAVDCPEGARFVGNTMAINPYPLLIPCHRVVRSDRRLGHFSSGVDLKRRLLRLEKSPAANYP